MGFSQIDRYVLYRLDFGFRFSEFGVRKAGKRVTVQVEECGRLEQRDHRKRMPKKSRMFNEGHKKVNLIPYRNL